MGAGASKPPPAAAPQVGKSGKKICCSCPDTKAVRDACVGEHGADAAACAPLIEAHKTCLRAEVRKGIEKGSELCHKRASFLFQAPALTHAPGLQCVSPLHPSALLRKE